MTARVVSLALAQVLIGLGAVWVIRHQALAVAAPTPLVFGLFTAVLVALTLLPPIYVELRRHGSWITPADSALVVGLFLLGPVGLVAAVGVAELVVILRVRQAWLKQAFNLVAMVAGSAVGGAVFAVVGRTDPTDAVAWAAAILALVVISIWDAVVQAAVLAVSEHQSWAAMARGLTPAFSMSLVVSAPLGLSALVLFVQSPYALLLLVPVLGVLHVSTRAISHQRAERRRFQQLYQSSSTLAQLVDLRDMLGLIADHARGIETGAAAVAIVTEADGSVTGVVASDAGLERLPDGSLLSIRALAGEDDQGQATADEIDRSARGALPPFLSLIWAQRTAGETGRLLVAVLREFPPDGNDGHRSEVLGAFIAHGATAVENVGLHADVQHALRHEQELNQQKSDFVAAVSHELRTPLASMSASMQTLARHNEWLAPADREELISLGLQQGDRLQSLIEDLLVVAAADHRAIEVAPSTSSIEELVSDLEREFRPRLEGRLRTQVDVRDDRVTTDRDKLRRILVNLLENARKYAPGTEVVLSAQQMGDRFRLAVTDDGPGIGAEDRERIFERFTQLDQSSTRKQGGTGLGLHLAWRLADLIHADLRVEDGPQGGARFIVELTCTAYDDGDWHTAPDDERSLLPAGIRQAPWRSTADRRPASIGAVPASGDGHGR